MAEYFPIDVSSLGSYSGSFSGSFFGNGSRLTGITASFFSGSVTSASYAATASYLLGSIASASYSATASYVNPLVQNVIITGSIYIPDSTNSIYFSGSGAASRLVWNNTDGTLDLGLKGGNVTLQIGQEQVIQVVNKTGANLLEADYKAVRIRRVDEGGAQGQRLAIVLAQANNDANSVDTLGLVTEDIAVNQEGFITNSGLVRNIDTTGTLQGETWVDGDVLYLSPTISGSVTKVKPQAPQHTIVMGYVVYAHANNGKIFVKVDNGYELDELHNVRITTASLSSGDLLVYSSSVWINTKQLTGSYGLTGSLQATSFTGSLLGTASNAVNALTASFINSASTNAFVQGGNSFGTTAVLGTNDNQSLAFRTNGSTKMLISGSGVGIGNTPQSGFSLDTISNIVTRASFYVNNDIYFFGASNSNIRISGLRFTDIGTSTTQVNISTAGNLGIGIGTTAATSRLQVRGTGSTSATTALRVENTNASASLVVLDDGNVGISTTTPAYRLDVSGSGNFAANLTVTGSTTLHNGQTTIQGAGATSATNALVVRNSNASSALTITNARSSSFGGNVDIAGDLNATNSSGTRKFQAGYFYDIHPEALNPGVIPFYSNDIAYNTLRGGQFTASFGPGSTYTLNTSQIEAIFDGSPNYCIMDPTQLSGSMTASIVFPQTYYYDNIIGFSFGNTNWVARDFTVEILVTGSYVTLDTQTGYTAANYTKGFNYAGLAVTGARIRFSNFATPANTTGFRIAEIFLLNFNGQLGKAVFMGRDGGAVYKPITIQSGSTTAPAYSSLTDTNTGIYFPAADTLGFVEGGAEAMRINSSGQVGIGTTSPAFTLDVSGSGRFTNGLTVTGSLIAPSITGSLQGTASWATNVVSASGASTNVQYNSSGLLAGNNRFTFDGTTVRISGGSLIITGSSTISGSSIITGSLQVGVPGTNNAAIDTTTGTLSRGPVTTIDWVNRNLQDTSGVTSADWENKVLQDASAATSVDWENRALPTINGTTAFEYATTADDYASTNLYLTQLNPSQIQRNLTENILYSGHIIEGTIDASVSPYDIMYLDTDGIWYPLKNLPTVSTKMLGIEVGGNILLDGDMTVSDDGSAGTYVVSADHGLPVYLSGTTGQLTTVQPTTDVIRVVGHIYYQNPVSTNVWLMKFRPSNDWTQI